MPIEDVFSISGHRTAVTGCVEQGKANVGYELEIIIIGNNLKTTCTRVEMLIKLLDCGGAGDNIEALIWEVKRETFSFGNAS